MARGRLGQSVKVGGGLAATWRLEETECREAAVRAVNGSHAGNRTGAIENLENVVSTTITVPVLHPTAAILDTKLQSAPNSHLGWNEGKTELV